MMMMTVWNGMTMLLDKFLEHFQLDMSVLRYLKEYPNVIYEKLLQIVGGRMAEYFGFKKLYGLGLLLTCILTFLSPVVARLNVWAFMVLRICQGLFEGVTFPSLHCMTARWIPIKERNSFIARSYFGSVFGLIISYPLCGLLIDSFGWDSAFYVIGGITLTWFLFWTFLVFDTPDSHPRISKEELEYITTELSNTVSKKTKPIPWKSILTSVPFWGMVITDCGNCVGIITLGSYGSLYLKKMLGVDIKANGVLSGVPMLSRYLGGLVTAAMADYLLKHRGWSVVKVRRVFNSICMCGPAVTMAILAFPPAGSQCSVTMTVCLLTTGMFLNGAISPGHFSSPGDLSPNYAGTIFGMSNTLSGGGVGYLTPVMVSTITGYYGYTFEAWTIVFSIASSVYIVANIFYFFMISGSIQPWNDYDSINK